MTRIGLTGGIASGKSTVADLLAGHGAVIIDADVLAREVVEPGTPGLQAVVARFGDQVLVDGRLDRAKLGSIVFADEGARRDLERIVHPAVRRRARELEGAAPPGSVVVQVIPLLVETGQQGAYDVCVVVDVDPATQVARLAQRNGLTADEAQQRLDAQARREDRLAAADYVIRNDGTLDDLQDQVRRLWAELRLAGARN